MPDLGQHADTVLLAYAISAVLLGGLGFLTWWQSRKARIALRAAEDLLKKPDPS